ncbi:hypothetical protein EJB05_33283, partial [Eragrostis curvula]
MEPLPPTTNPTPPLNPSSPVTPRGCRQGAAGSPGLPRPTSPLQDLGSCSASPLEALDLLYFSSPEQQHSAERAVEAKLQASARSSAVHQQEKNKEKAKEQESFKPRLKSIVVRPQQYASYRDVVAGQEIGRRKEEKATSTWRIQEQKRNRSISQQPKPKEDTKQDQKSAALGGGGDGSLASTIAGPQLERSIRIRMNSWSFSKSFQAKEGMVSPSQCRSPLCREAPCWGALARPHGKEILRCSGMIIRWEKENAWILTSDRIAYCTKYETVYNTVPKLAVLKIEVKTMFEMEHPCYGGIPSYGDKCGVGGLVINDAGDVVGISFDDQDPAVLSSTTIRKCIEMWTKFGRVARPVLGMWLRSVFLLDIAYHERLRCKYGINNGFIVDEVVVDSTAEKCGVRKGNVITSFDGVSCSLPELEDFLLSVGMASLDGMERVNDFKFTISLDKLKELLFCPYNSLM